MPPGTPARLLADLPPGVAWARWPAEGPLVDDVQPAVYVPRFGDRERTRAHLAALRDLRWVQTLSAGVDWILDLVPPGVPLHDARGVHDVAVAEWVVGPCSCSRGISTATPTPSPPGPGSPGGRW